MKMKADVMEKLMHWVASFEREREREREAENHSGTKPVTLQLKLLQKVHTLVKFSQVPFYYITSRALPVIPFTIC